MHALVVVSLCLLAYWISGIVHEAGHLVVGLLNGWKFHLLVVGPMGFKLSEQGKVVLYYEKNMIFWGGVGATLPRDNNPSNLSIWKKVLAGGPAASIIMGAIFLPIGMYTNSVFLLLLGAMPLGMGIACGLPIPLKTGILYTDGGRLARLNSEGQKYYEEKALFMLTQSSICSNRLEDADYADIEYLIRSEDKSIKYYGYYYSYCYHSAKGNTTNVAEAIARMNELKSSVSRVVVEDCKIA